MKVKKPIKDQQIVVRITNYESLTLKLESAKKNTPVSKLVRNKLFDYAEAKEYALSRRTLLSKAVDKYRVMAQLVKRLYNA